MNFGYLVLFLVILTVSAVGMALRYHKYLDKKYYNNVDIKQEESTNEEQKGRLEIKEEQEKEKKRKAKDAKIKPTTDISVLICGFLGGAFGLLISYFVFPLIRKEDEFNSHRFLIITIVTSIITLVTVILLCVFGVVKFQ